MKTAGICFLRVHNATHKGGGTPAGGMWYPGTPGFSLHSHWSSEQVEGFSLHGGTQHAAVLLHPSSYRGQTVRTDGEQAKRPNETFLIRKTMG
jgi:hypothetical protein